ncbi:hypothetical protein EWM64_g2308 [Hericium alpestre]|uniref:PPP4R2-domain-containing protein n=1 Tax=Hericium alpestre TaxID=135208 RepID=A0A4Z0A5V1_9AGAM|nr:hypothetical protein EWM64_g2308 [Hericium alpestre]
MLDKIASTDEVQIEWPKLRDIIKYKVDQNVSSFLADQEKLKSAHPPPFNPEPSTTGGLKIPPFPPRERNDENPNEAPKVFLSEEEAKEIKESLFAQLDNLDDTPFTIQRLSEVCEHPTEHYTTVGKYLRAVERTLYVTSSWSSFPPLPPQAGPTAIPSTPLGVSSTSVPSTPLFSPIPFLHNDARRSKSRSPPPSPLALTAVGPGGGVPLDTAAMALGDKAMGMVDEMDDPGPGHLSDRPTALSSVTSVGEGSGVMTLEDRFVKGSEGNGEGADAVQEPEAKRPRQDGDEDMNVDERDGDKENKS